MQDFSYGSDFSSIENEKKEERLAFLKAGFLAFQVKYKEKGTTIEFVDSIDKVLEEVNTYYWEFIAFIKEEKYVVKRGVPEETTKLNIYKIISATELAIIKIQPIKGDRLMNANLAFTMSLYLYRTWFQRNLKSVSLTDSNLSQIWSKFLEDRLIWLTNINTSYEFPFFLNSQVWMLIDLLTRNEVTKN